MRPERLWTGGVWTEGPAWQAREGRLIWSDIPNNRMLGLDLAEGRVGVFREPSRGGNGNTVDRRGRLVTCEQFARRITRTEPDGSLTVLADRYEGKRFNAPNDVVVKSDGSIWFTDPDYGSGSPHYQGERELEGCHVYRIDPRSGTVRQMIDDMVMPNGLAFSPDERCLYVIDTGSTHYADGPNHIRVFDVDEDSNLSGSRVLAEDAARFFDGMRIDRDGRLWCGVGEGVRCYQPDGTMIGRILLPERASNLTFAGPDLSLLLICGTTSLYAAGTRVTSAIRA